MSEIPDLLVALATLVGALSSAFVLVYTTIRRERGDNRKAANQAATETAAAVLDAVKDGEITADEIEGIQQTLRREEP